MVLYYAVTKGERGKKHRWGQILRAGTRRGKFTLPTVRTIDAGKGEKSWSCGFSDGARGRGGKTFSRH